MLIPATDVAIVAGLLEHPAKDANDLARKILRALYANDDVKSISATRGVVVVKGPQAAPWARGPYATVDAAWKAAAVMNNSGKEKFYPMRLAHPSRKDPGDD